MTIVLSFMSSASFKQDELAANLVQILSYLLLLLFLAITNKYVFLIKLFVIFLDFCCFFFFFGQFPQKMCYGDQNHHHLAIYLNVSNFLMIYQPKNNNENLSLSGWYLAPILPGLDRL